MQEMQRLFIFLFFATSGALLSAAASPQQRLPSSDKSAAAVKVIRVGATREVRTLGRAAEIARDGDVIEVDPGEYKGDSAVWTQNDLVIRGIGARPRLVADGAAAEGKGIFVIRGSNVTLENLAFSGARVADRNGAGVRLDRGRLRIVQCTFEDNENGILTSNDPDIELHVVESTFSENGAGDGQSHHLYAGTIASLHVMGSYFGPARTGHLLKSRAKATSVYYSRLTGEGGSSSYEMDLPAGGKLIAIGNLVQQGNRTENPVMISYGAEGYRWPDNHAYIAFNTLINDRPDAGVFIAIRSGPAEATISNNIFVGRGEVDAKSKAVVTGNVRSQPSDFADPSKFDYRLRSSSLVAGNAGPVSAFAKENRPARQYRHIAGSEELTGLTDSTRLSPGAFQRLAR